MAHADNVSEPLPVSVLHWWTSEGESRAADALRSQLLSQGIRWVDLPIPGGAGMAAVKVLKSRVLMGTPPDVAQIIGTTLMDWVDAGLVLTLDGVAEEQRWAQAIFSTVQERITHHGATIAVPLGVHRINNLYFNRHVFARLGLQPPRTWADYEKVSSIFRQQGIQALAWSDQAWQIATVFETVLLGYASGSGYQRLMVERSASEWMGPAVREALVRLRSLRQPGLPVNKEISWTAAARKLLNGQAAMMIMGDWVTGELSAWGAQAGVDFGCLAVPGTAGSHLFSLDTLAMLKTTRPLRATQEKMAQILTSGPAQMAYNLAKGSIPVRRDIDPRALDPCSLESWKTFADPKSTRVPSLAHRMVAGEATKDAVTQILWRFITLGIGIAETQNRLASVMQKPLIPH